MAKSCARFQPVKPGSEEHNRRLKHLDYVRQELTKNNKSWAAQSVADRLAEVKQLVKEKTGRAMQSKATPIREAVVLIKQVTTMDDLHRLRAAYKEKFGIDVFQIDIHKDEGHFNKKGDWIGNYHAHVTADFTDHRTGKSLKLSRQQMSDLQTVTAEVLGMERGIPSGKKHLNAIQFKIQEETKKLEELRQEVADMNISKATKQRILGVLGMSSKDKMIDAQGEEIEKLKKVITSLRETNKQLQEAIKAEKQKASQAAADGAAATRVQIARAAGLYQARPNQKCDIRELEEDIRSLRSRERSYYLENQELKKENQRLKRDMEPDQTQQLHR
jgi:HAMP domain-containing protein